MMYELNLACNNLKNNSSRKEKENILELNKDFMLLRDVLRFLCDKNITSGIDIRKINVEISTPFATPTFDDLSVLLHYVKNNNTGTLRDIYIVQNSIKDICNGNSEYEQLCKDIITKSLKLGIDAKTVNKVYGEGFIPTFDVQLGTPIDKCIIPEGAEIVLTQKLNGVRCVYCDGKLYSRTGKEYTGCNHIISDIKKMFNFLKMPERVIDGELVLKDCGLSDSEAFQKGTGIANSDMKNKTELKLVIFDTIDTSQFHIKICTENYIDRRSIVMDYMRAIIGIKLNNIETVRCFYRGNDHSKIWEYLEYAEQNDMEGIMINLNTPYEFKRTKNLIKVKKFYDIDLECIEVLNAEKGKYKDTLGAIVCKYGNNVVKVGSGFTDEQRDYYYNNQDKIIGKIVSVKYKEKTKNKDGSESLQFPVFLCVREDKDEADV